MVFRWLQNGTPVPINPFASAAVNPATGQKRCGTTSWARPERCSSCSRSRRTASPTPADFNALGVRLPAQDLERHAQPARVPARSAGPDGSGFYTVTLTGVTIPDNAGHADRRDGLLVQRRRAPSRRPRPTWPSFPVSAPVGGAGTEPGGRPDRDRARRQVKVATRPHRPARDRRGPAPRSACRQELGTPANSVAKKKNRCHFVQLRIARFALYLGTARRPTERARRPSR